MKKVLSRTVLYALLILAVFFTACRAASSSKVKPMPVCGNGIKEEGETCKTALQIVTFLFVEMELLKMVRNVITVINTPPVAEIV